jgi:hypothetical protein
MILRIHAALLATLLAVPAQAFAWGATGHRIIGVLGAESLPPELPAFLRTPQATTEIGELAREPDRSKSAGREHDADRDPAHFLDLDDSGKVLGGPLLSAMPPTRSDYETALRVAGADSWRAGYLYYSIVDGWQQLVKDFAYWRALSAAERHDGNPEHDAWFKADRERREGLIVRDLGVWAHFVGDGSQPLHVTTHFNGWGPYPNPNGYTTSKIHLPVEGAFVHDNVGIEAVRGAMAPPRVCACSIQAMTADYLAATNAEVEPLYRLDKTGGFQDGDADGQAFAAARLAAGASAMRDMAVAAWRASETITVGWPETRVTDIEAGRIDPYEILYGID